MPDETVEKRAVVRPEMHLNDENWRTFQRYAGKKLLKKGQGIVLPQGVVIDNRPWRGFKHSIQVESFVMNRPDDLLVDPDPRCTYCWRPREDPKHSTEGLVNTGKLIPVDYDRVDLDSPLAAWVYDYSGTVSVVERDPATGRRKRNQVTTGLVACGNFALFEVPPDQKWEWYEQPVDATFDQLGGLGGMHDAMSEAWAQREGAQYKGSSMEVTDEQTVTQEMRNPRKGGPPIAVNRSE